MASRLRYLAGLTAFRRRALPPLWQKCGPWPSLREAPFWGFFSLWGKWQDLGASLLGGCYLLVRAGKGPKMRAGVCARRALCLGLEIGLCLHFGHLNFLAVVFGIFFAS